MKILRLAMMGFGNAGRAFAKLILQKEEEISKLFGVKILTTAIATATKGNLVDEKGIDLNRALWEIERSGHFDESWSAYSQFNSWEIIEKVEYDILIEITPLNIFTGQPAIDNIKIAMSRKKHVITANKGPIAWAYKELKLLSKAKKTAFLYETTVMDGTPVFNMVEETLPLCKILEFNGILNTTTNFVLDEMAKGKTLDEAVEAGKLRGFVEAEPRLDIEGFDAAAKTAALINVLMEGDITPEDIKRTGIQYITNNDIIRAGNENKLIKLLCHGEIKDGKVIGQVNPVEIPKEHIFASVTGTSSILSLKTDLMGEVTIVEHLPEIEQTGYGLFSDLLRLIKKLTNDQI
jgi:homoserine dehydrogenase